MHFGDVFKISGPETKLAWTKRPETNRPRAELKDLQGFAIQANTKRTTPPPPPPSILMQGRCKILRVSYYTAISRKVVGKKGPATIPKGNMGYDQYTSPDTVMQLSNLPFLFSFSTPKLILPRPLVPFFQISLKNSELKTSHNTYRACLVHFFRQPFSKQLYTNNIRNSPFLSGAKLDIILFLKSLWMNNNVMKKGIGIGETRLFIRARFVTCFSPVAQFAAPGSPFLALRM